MSYQAFQSIRNTSKKNKKIGSKIVNSLNYGDIKFGVYKKDYSKIEKRSSICINVFDYESGVVYLVHATDEKFEIYIDLSLLYYL